MTTGTSVFQRRPNAYDRMQPAYDRNMQPAYDRMQAAFYDRMQAACVPSVTPALEIIYQQKKTIFRWPIRRAPVVEKNLSISKTKGY